MNLSKPQQAMHWSLWKRCLPILLSRNSDLASRISADDLRHQLYLQALGEEKSLTEFNNDDLDKVKAAMLAIVEPGNLNAQLHALNGQRKRLLFGIRQLAKSMGVDEFYVQGIIDRMDARRGSRSKPGADKWQRELERVDVPQRSLEDLHPHELTKVIVALKKHEQRLPSRSRAKAGGVIAEPELVEMPF